MALKCTVEDLREVEVIRNRAVIYARYSSDKQKEASIEQQVKECSDYIARKGYSLIRVYSDSAKSASHDVEKRSDFLKLIEDAEYGEFDVVVSYALDRISREEHGGFYGYENALNRNGVRIEYATQVFDDGYGGEISKAVHVTMASEYVAQLRKNVVRGMRDNVKNGRFNGGSAVPIGLKVVGEGKKSKRYAVDETTSPFVKQAFDMYLAGMTTGEIMQFLNDNGVRTSRGSKVNRDTVNRILANPIYIGTKVSVFNNKVEHKVYTTEGVVDPIVSEDVWERVQIMRESRQHKGAAEPARKRYILRGKLFCGLCGTEMITESGRSANGNKYCYYICERRKHGKGDERCRKQNVPKDAIEEAVLAIVTQRIWSDYQIDEYVRAAKEAIRLHEEDPRIVQLKSEIKRHTEKKKRAMQCYLDTDDPEWYDLSKEESRLIKECEAELAIRIRQDNAPKEAEDFLAELENIAAAWDTMLQSDEGRQNIIQTYVERIDIFDPEPDDPGKCRIDLLIRTDPGAECAERIQSEVECAVRNCEKEVHQAKQFAQKGGLFSFFLRRESNRRENRAAVRKKKRKDKKKTLAFLPPVCAIM